MRGLLFAVFALFAGQAAQAQADACNQSEPACVLQAAWGAALILPEDKQRRLAPAFLEIADLSGDPELLAFWQTRLGDARLPTNDYADYGWQKAAPILESGGVDRLIEVAIQRADPLSFGRADALLSAGRHLFATDPDGARRLNEALLDLSASASSFEKPSLAHAATELAMVRCDSDLFSRAVARTDAPGNLRYRLWRARMSGSVRPLLSEIRAIDNDQDTRDVRRVLEGYRATLELGYCDAPKRQIGG